MSAFSHVKSNAVADFTGTITGFNSQGSTQTIAATNLVRPSDWNSAHAFYQTISGNTAGQSTASGTNLVFGGTNNATVSLSTGAGAATLWVDSPSPPNRSFIQIVEGERFTTVLGLSATNVTNRPILQPFWMDGVGLVANTVRMMMSFGASSNRSLGGTFHAGIYSAINATQMTLLASDSWSVSSTVSASSASWNGPAVVDWTGMSNVTLTAEGRYAFAFMVQPVSANVTWMPVSVYGGDPTPSVSRVWSNGATSATNATQQFVPFWGVYSTTTGSFPATIAATQINGGNSASQQDLFAVIKEI